MKLGRAAPADELYISPWFRKARAYVTGLGAPWRILSAKYGLLEPAREISPYEMTLKTMAVTSRRTWARIVLDELEDLVNESIVILAGAAYREFLVPELEARGVSVSVPLQGLGLGEQLRWFDRQMAQPAPAS